MAEQETFHIFIVDDEKVISETLATILRIHGFAATSFTNPFEALNVSVRATHLASDLLIC